MATGGQGSSALTWHYDGDVYKAIKDFHDTCTRIPSMGPEKQLHKSILEAIEKELRKDCFSTAAPMVRYEHTGSTYDGVKIGRDGLEFDTMVVVKGGNTLTAVQQSKPGYYNLRSKGSGVNPLAAIFRENGLLSSDLAKRKFTGRLQKIINESPDLQRHHIRLVNHGPAVQMDVYEEGGRNKIYSVDMVVAFEIDHMYYVAKPFLEAGDQAADIWRISYSLREKSKLDGLDRGNMCRKQALRVCKAMRIDQAELKLITSYILKNALFYEVDELGDPNDWRQEKLAARVLGLWIRLANYMDNGKMGSYYNHEMDLLDNIPPKTKENIRDRIRRFCNNKNEFFNMIKRIKAQY